MSRFMGISLFLTGLSRSFSSAFLMRLITGMGNGGAVVPMMALTANWFVAGKRGLAAGILTMGTGLGLSIVGVALPHVIAKYGPNGWRYAWFLLGTLVFILSFVCFALLRDNPAEKRTSMYGGEEKQKSRKPVTLKELIETDFGIFLITFSISALAGAPGTQKWAFKTSQVVNSFPAIGYP